MKKQVPNTIHIMEYNIIFVTVKRLPPNTIGNLLITFKIYFIVTYELARFLII